MDVQSLLKMVCHCQSAIHPHPSFLSMICEHMMYYNSQAYIIKWSLSVTRSHLLIYSQALSSKIPYNIIVPLKSCHPQVQPLNQVYHLLQTGSNVNSCPTCKLGSGPSITRDQNIQLKYWNYVACKLHISFLRNKSYRWLSMVRFCLQHVIFAQFASLVCLIASIKRCQTEHRSLLEMPNCGDLDSKSNTPPDTRATQTIVFSCIKNTHFCSFCQAHLITYHWN